MRLTSTLLLGSIAITALVAGQARAALFSNGTPVAGAIAIDGDMSDWTGDMIVGTDPNEGVISDSADLANFYFANDETYLYGRFDVHGPQVSTSDSSNRVVWYIFDTDNNRTTGLASDRNPGTTGDGSVGNERELRVFLARDDKPAFDQLYADNPATPAVEFNPATSDLVAATDGLTGREWRVSLADLGITGNTIVSYHVFQDWQGDIWGGNTWNDAAPTFREYTLVIPEPASLSVLLGAGAMGLALRRKRSYVRTNG